MTDKQTISRARVSEHGEVYTPDREVNAMLDLVAAETERIDSRFLEPACGRGNFLAAVLRRKLDIVDKRYRASRLEYERYAVLAVSSIYGIDILADNVAACRDRLAELFENRFAAVFGAVSPPQSLAAVRFILDKNVVVGDALTLMTAEDPPKPIVFAEWSPVNGSLLKRRDFTFRALLHHEQNKELPLFSDLGEEVFIPTPLKDYPPVHFSRIADAD